MKDEQEETHLEEIRRVSKLNSQPQQYGRKKPAGLILKPNADASPQGATAQTTVAEAGLIEQSSYSSLKDVTKGRTYSN
jgi:hypothetical protein